MKCFYHNDPDGKCAAFWVHNANVAQDDYEPYFQTIDYGRPFPHDMVQANELVFIVDFSIDPKDMDLLIEKCGLENIVWIDHHKTAIANYEDYPHEIPGIREDGTAACELAYQFMQWWRQDAQEKYSFEQFRRTLTAPMFTKLIADRDVWRWEFGKATKFFFAGSQLLDLRPFSDEWERLLSEEGYCEQIQENGKLIEQFRARQHRIDINFFAYPVEFEGYNCLAVNAQSSGDLGQEMRNEGAEIAIIYRRNKEHDWTVSLYSDKIDVGEIARAFGGGGHRGAAGFKTQEDPEKLWITQN